MEIASFSSQASHVASSKAAHKPWALPKHIDFDPVLNPDDLIPPNIIFSQKPENFCPHHYLANLKKEDLTVEVIPSIKHFLDDWPATKKYPTLRTDSVQAYFKILLRNERMSEAHYGPWIDMFIYLLKSSNMWSLEPANQRVPLVGWFKKKFLSPDDDLEPAIEHVLYGLQSLAIKHHGRADSRFTENLKTVVDLSIEHLRARLGSKQLRPWAHEILIPEKGLSSEMKNFEAFRNAVSYEPTIRTFMEKLQSIHLFIAVIEIINSNPDQATKITKIAKLYHTEFPNETFEDVEKKAQHLIKGSFSLNTPESTKQVQEDSMVELKESLISVTNFALPRTPGVSAQSKTAVVMLLYHMALPSLEWMKKTGLPEWAKYYLQLLEDQDTPLSHSQKLAKAVRQELETKSLGAMEKDEAGTHKFPPGTSVWA